MQNYMETLTSSNFTSFLQCVLELVINSLTAQSTAIAIRIHTEKREIQVIDNGVGIQKHMLEHIGEYDINIMSTRQCTYNVTESYDSMLTNIRRLSDTFIVASRYQYSMKTFMKVFKVDCAPHLMQIEQRPSQGATVSVYGFHDIPLKKNWDISTICFLIAVMAVEKLKVSFSIRDEKERKIVLRIAKPHNAIEVLKILFGKNLPLNYTWLIQCNSECSVEYHGYIGLADKNAVQCIFLNHKPISCPFILKLIKVGFKESLVLSLCQSLNVQDLQDKNIFILFFLTFPQKEFTFVNENGKKYVIFYDMQKILNSIKTCSFQYIAEKNIVYTSHLHEAQLMKQIYLKSKTSFFNNNNNNKYDRNVISSRKNKIATTDFKKKKVISRSENNYSNKQQNKSHNFTTCYIEKENGILDSIRFQVNTASTKNRKLCDDKIVEKMDNDDKTQTNCTNFAISNIFIESDKIHNHNNNFINNISPLSNWSNWTYYTKEHNTVENLHAFTKNNVHFQQFFKCTKQFDFLPSKLHNLLKHAKLTNIKCLNSSATISSRESWQNEQVNIHSCNLKHRLCEFKLSHASLERIKIINQINNKFIVGWMMYDEMKILLMIDQHAVHERIRYEDLRRRYMAQNESGLLSANLRNPLVVKFPTKMCNLLLHNKILLKKYGISLGSLKGNKLLIRAIPRCLITNKDHYNSEKILLKIYNLLKDILKNRGAANTNVLLKTIHNAIASKACHGAIKFGDKLTFGQCTRLLKLLKYTKSPNRCVHGRPTIIPMMELSELEKRNAKKCKEKLNFTSLKKYC